MLENKLSLGVLDQMKIRLTQPSFTETGAWAELGNIQQYMVSAYFLVMQEYFNLTNLTGFFSEMLVIHYHHYFPSQALTAQTGNVAVEHSYLLFITRKYGW